MGAPLPAHPVDANVDGRTKSRRFGLALSGGGFRAAFFHLGVVRFLRDAALLPGISRITSVSGGSILAAHMALNWERYCGTEDDFHEITRELLRFVRMDVRNRIVRRFPLLAAVNTVRRISFLGIERQYTRAGLLETHYRDYLYGDRALLHLPESPRTYILATNLSEGSLCAFCREGLLLQRRSGGSDAIEIETIPMGLATIAMAVAASSAYPGFFPPLELSGRDVGATDGEFSRHAFTDGGIYDNLGLRMFRLLQGPEVSTGGGAPSEELAGVFVSDAGATLKVRPGGRAGGLLRTALRASDILMDRVNQLELEAFAGTSGAVFIPITRIVEQAEDPRAVHPEVQKQVALIRTDFDRFSDLEITALVQHGYGVARQAVRGMLPAQDQIPDGPPWDPLGSSGSMADPSVALPVARTLQRSSIRRTLTTLFSPWDWPTYVWVPLILVALFTVPTVLLKMRRTAIRQQQVLTAIARSSPLYGEVLDLLRNPQARAIPPIEFTEVDAVEPLDFTGYEVVSDDRIYDLRGWTSSDHPRHPAMMHARFRMLKTAAAEQRPLLRIQLPSTEDSMRVEYRPRELKPVHVRARTEDGLYIYQTYLDFSHVPVGAETALVVRQAMPDQMATQDFGNGRFKFTVAARTGLVRIWVLLPPGRPHGQFELYRWHIDRPEVREIVRATTSVEVPTGAIATFELINPSNGYRYECRWRWLDGTDGDR